MFTIIFWTIFAIVFSIAGVGWLIGEIQSAKKDKEMELFYKEHPEALN